MQSDNNNYMLRADTPIEKLNLNNINSSMPVEIDDQNEYQSSSQDPYQSSCMSQAQAT